MARKKILRLVVLVKEADQHGLGQTQVAPPEEGEPATVRDKTRDTIEMRMDSVGVCVIMSLLSQAKPLVVTYRFSLL